MKILAINPGSTSTKFGVFEDENLILYKSIAHSNEDLAQFDDAIEQQSYRQELVLQELRNQGVDINELDAVIGRGGLVKPIAGGTYEINQQMIDDTRHGIVMHNHVCNLGCLIAHDIAAQIPGCRSFIADPGVVDEMNDYVRISGSPLMNRICIWHALNQKAIARRFAKDHGTRYEDLNLIMCHLGGGISVAAHDHGRAVDANNALDGEGPFSPERAGSLPAVDLIRLCYSQKYTEKELLKRIAGKGGLMGHLGTNSALEVEKRIADGDEHARLVYDAMCYHVAKNLAGLAAVLKGKVDAIILTGGLARSEYVTDHLKDRLSWLAPIYIYPGEDELTALCQNALAVLRGEREAQVYS